MTVLKKYNDGTSEWETVVVGKQGPVGPAGVVYSATAPTDTTLVWVDTSESGTGFSLDDLADVDEGAGASDGEVLTYNGSASAWEPALPPLVVVEHGSDANAARPAASVVYWKGSVDPVNSISGDIWYDTTGDA